MKGTGITPKARAAVYARDSIDGFPNCIYCGYPSQHLHLHHVIKRSQGGLGDERNLVSLCFECHMKIHNGDEEIQKYCEEYLAQIYGEGTCKSDSGDKTD